MEFLNSLRDVKSNWNKYNEWERKELDERAQKTELAKTAKPPKDKVDITDKKVKTVIRAAELMDARSEDNATNSEMLFGLLSFFTVLIPFAIFQPFIIRKALKGQSTTKLNIAQVATVFLAATGTILWGTHEQKKASRIGRFQARQNELKDVKNFVIYTPEQIEAAKILVKNMPDKKDEKTFLKMFAELKQMYKDQASYKKWLEEKIKNPDDIEKLLKLKFSPEQLAQGDEDKEIIIDIMKEVNIKAEEYSENLENAFDTISVFSGILAIPFALAINKILKLFTKVTPTMRGVVSAAAAFLTALMVMTTGKLEQKQASRIGRHIARREILENPSRFINYSADEMKKVAHIKSDEPKKGFFSGFVDDFKFLYSYFGDKKEYQKYKQTEFKEEEKLYDALKQQNVSDKQLKEGKNFREKIFLAFDKIDEMSQRYSEDTEAATEILKQSVGLAYSLFSYAVVIGIPFLAYKGKIPTHKFLNGLSKLVLKKESNIRTLINEGSQIISADKNLKKNFIKGFLDSSAKEELFKNEKIAGVYKKLQEEFISLIFKNSGEDDAIKGIQKALQEHFKNGPIAKWMKNLMRDILKLKVKDFADKDEIGLLKNAVDTEAYKFNYQNYSTLINTVAASFIPAVAFIVTPVYAFNAWLTGIQKKAGKIGIMKAMNEIDDARVFVDLNAKTNDVSPGKSAVANENKTLQQSDKNLLTLYKLQTK